MSFPPPDVASLRCPPDAPILSMQGASCEYADRDILADVTLHMTLSSKVAIVGDNGAGKTSLLRLMAGKLDPLPGCEGSVSTRAGLSLAMVGQHHAEALREYGRWSPAQ